jgi:hypothetical protein
VAIKSPINPQTIAKERQATMPAAMNFISGGSPLGSSIVSSAANKIVGFQRGASSVAPRTPDLGSIIKTLSSNILTNVENRVQSINQNVNNIINQSLKSFGQDYQNRLKQIDDTKPNSILSNFLKLYQQAIGYIQFLGNRRNVKTLGDNLQALQRIFAETFEVAKIIRQTIVKIVKQLSNLPTASTGGGGLNLDVNVPGGPLKRSAPRGITRMLKMAGTGAAIAGAGALGTKVVSGMMDVGEEEVQTVPGPGSEGLSGPILDRFNAILERFDAAISSMTKKPPAAPSAPAGGGDVTSETPPPSAPPGPSPGGVSSGSEDMMTLAAIAALESGSAQGQSDVAQSVYNRLRDPAYKGKSIKDLLTKQGQYQVAFKDPTSSSGRGTEIADEFKNIKNEDDGVKAMMSYYNKRGQKITPEQARQKFRGAVAAIQNPELQKKSAQFVGGRTEFLGAGSNPTGAIWRGSGSDNKFFAEYGNKQKNLQMGAAAVPTGLFTTSPSTVAAAPPKPGVAAAPTQAATAQQVSQTVAQPAQQKPQVTVLPMAMNTGSTPTPSKPPSPSGPPAPNMNSGRMLPSLSSTNHDNFLTLYSKMVYNIVDG